MDADGRRVQDLWMACVGKDAAPRSRLARAGRRVLDQVCDGDADQYRLSRSFFSDLSLSLSFFAFRASFMTAFTSSSVISMS